MFSALGSGGEKLLSHHAREHKQGDRECGACILAQHASSMREGKLTEAGLVARMVRQGVFGKPFCPTQRKKHPQCDASELLLGVESVEQRGRYNGLAGVLDAWEDEDFWQEPGVDHSAYNESGRKRHVMDSVLFGILLRTRKHLSLIHI